MAAVDEFVIFDEVQFTRGNWRNRNRSRYFRWLHPHLLELYRRAAQMSSASTRTSMPPTR
jgi:hypothetical protein